MVETTEITEEEMRLLNLEGATRYGYPWGNWFNGKWHMVPWDQLDQDPGAFRGLAYKAGHRAGIKVECKAGPKCWLLRGRLHEDC